MKLILTARRGTITDRMRDQAEKLMKRAAIRAHRPHRGEVVFDVDRDRKIVEVRVFMARGKVFACQAEAGNFRAALTRVSDKLQNHFDKPPTKGPRRKADRKT